MATKVTIVSFAFGAGIPNDSSMVFNARFLQPPANQPGFMKLTGKDKQVQEYIETDPDFKNFFTNLFHMAIIFLRRFPVRYPDPIVIAVGCTGGQHRSVYTVEKLAMMLGELDYEVSVRHRELEQIGNLTWK